MNTTTALLGAATVASAAKTAAGQTATARSTIRGPIDLLARLGRRFSRRTTMYEVLQWFIGVQSVLTNTDCQVLFRMPEGTRPHLSDPDRT